MMFLIKLIFWVLTCILIYTYLGYGVILWILVKFRRRKNDSLLQMNKVDLPRVAHIIAAYNEEDFIAGKIDNSLAIDYPGHLHRIIVVADGSSDRTVEIVESYPQVELLFLPARKGKVAAINRAVVHAGDTDIVVFSDANSLLDPASFSYMMSHYHDPKIGGVSGEKKVMSAGKVLGQGEGLYWRYESYLKQLDSDFHSVVGAAGELFSIRRELFEKVPEYIILDDFYISLNVCRRGLIVKYESRAVAIEGPSFSLADERKRKVRISAGAFQSMLMMKDLLNFTTYGKLSFQYISRRVLRLAICPFILPIILMLNMIIMINGGGYMGILSVQILFYTLSFIGWLMVSSSQNTFKIFYIPYYFVFMNFSVWAGFFRYLYGTQSAIWEKSKRDRLV